eukprot:TRINITY_DN86703_c0_g1_i1.p1 TRINITY_DN86703_c0_g1~~TRINITY_DN86703_c0_g1_i1.p1  ORF type:complete len:173 (+),score=41.58 TRINITY_DN86703_c0_g1_i1:64-519(+)
MVIAVIVTLAWAVVIEAGRASVGLHEQTKQEAVEADFMAYSQDVARFRSEADKGTLQTMRDADAALSMGNEICCMCSKFKDFKMVAFSVEDYDLGPSGRIECATECLGKCSEKGGTFMGCFDENTMVQMQKSWAMTGILKVKDDDRPGDIC